MKKLLLAAFVAVFFVSGVVAQEIPKPKPDCMTIGQFLAGYDYSLGFHPKMQNSAFAYIPDMDAIIILPMSGLCLSNKAGLVLQRGTKGFRQIYIRIVAGDSI